MRDIMIDLETFGTDPNAAIVQIGACEFDRTTGDIGRVFKCNITPSSSQSLGLTVDADTVLWWLKQSPEAQASITEAGKDIKTVLAEFNTFVASIVPNRNEVRIWSHATFDFVILTNAFNKAGIKPNFSHRGARDLRTITDLGKEEYWKPGYDQRVGVHHDALADCVFQVAYAVKAISRCTSWSD